MAWDVGGCGAPRDPTDPPPPQEWVPIIREDIQTQRKVKQQPPLSDAYLTGMPAKRRKVGPRPDPAPPRPSPTPLTPSSPHPDHAGRGPPLAAGRSRGSRRPRRWCPPTWPSREPQPGAERGAAAGGVPPAGTGTGRGPQGLAGGQSSWGGSMGSWGLWRGGGRGRESRGWWARVGLAGGGEGPNPWWGGLYS